MELGNKNNQLEAQKETAVWTCEKLLPGSAKATSLLKINLPTNISQHQRAVTSGAEQQSA